MQPPYTITNKILQLVASISEKIGEVNAIHLSKPPAALRKANRIKTIQSSLEIEGNTLSFDQITAILENKRVAGPQKDILEVKNAIAVYDKISQYQSRSLPSLLKAHKALMTGLIESPGKIRSKGVGIIKGSKIAHIAPRGEIVKPLLNDLFRYLKISSDLTLIKSCVFHYEFEFIHPFLDGNGRLGRLWQTIILKEQYPVFEYLPIETIIKKRQDQYYMALSLSDQAGSSTTFIEFMLSVIFDSLEELLATQNSTLTDKERLSLFKAFIGVSNFTRKDYLRNYKEISTATASRDLREGVAKGILKKSGDKRNATYQFIL
jgi:cell filamentation protein, protein adenylyltransferase